MRGAVGVDATITLIGALVLAVGVGVTLKVNRGKTQLESGAILNHGAPWKATAGAGVLLMIVGVVLAATSTTGNSLPSNTTLLPQPTLSQSPQASTPSTPPPSQSSTPGYTPSQSSTPDPKTGSIISGNGGLAVDLSAGQDGKEDLRDGAVLIGVPVHVNAKGQEWTFTPTAGPDLNHKYYQIQLAAETQSTLLVEIIAKTDGSSPPPYTVRLGKESIPRHRRGGSRRRRTRTRRGSTISKRAVGTPDA